MLRRGAYDGERLQRCGVLHARPGRLVALGVLRNGGQDFGAQVATAGEESPGEVIWSNEGETRGDDGTFSYNADFRNTSPSRDVSLSMQGGGF